MAYDGGYSGSDQEKALAWISDATGKPVTGPLLEGLKSGVALCELANALRPNTVKRISSSAMPFPQRENIKAFIDAARQFGVPDRDNFDTSDLFEGKNERQVLICIAALGRAAYAVPGYTGPALGQAATGAKGSPKHNVASGGGLWGKSGGGYGAVGGGVQVEATSRGVQQTRSPTSQARTPSKKKSPPKPSKPAPKPVEAAATKATLPQARASPASGAGGKPYDGGYSGSDQEKALAWISDATGKPVTGPLLEALKSGVALCELANALRPNTVKRISSSAMPFPQRENIKAFIDAARQFGVPDRDNFDTSDLFEGKNERQVLICIAALGRAAYAVPGYTGPALGQAATGAKGSPKHNVASGGGLWGKSGGGYGAVGGGVQVEATSRGVQQTRSPTSPQGLRLVEEGIPPVVDPTSMSGVLKKKKGVTASWADCNVAIQGDDLVVDSISSTGKGSMRIALGDMFDCQMLDAASGEFELVGPQTSMRFCAKSEVEAQQWIDSLALRLAVAPSPLSRPELVQLKKSDFVAMWGVQAELVADASAHNVLESISIAVSPKTTKAEFLSTLASAIGISVDDVDICAGRAAFYMAKFRKAAQSVPVTEFMNDGAIFSCLKRKVLAPAPAPASAHSAPTSRTTKPSMTHVGLHQGARSQFTHYKTGAEDVTEGLDATVARKMAAKYDLALQAEVCAWADSLGVQIDGSSMDGFMGNLKDGQLLCQLVNKIKPGSVRKVNKMTMPFMQMENISKFLAAATAIGVDSCETFQTVDLFEAKNPLAVLQCLASLMRVVTE